MDLLKTFIAEAPIGAAMFDPDMRYLAYSPHWLTNHQVDAIRLGDSHYDVFPDMPPHWRDVHRRALAGETIRAEEDRFLRASGSVIWLKWEVRPWRDQHEEVGGIVIFTEDVTRRKNAEDELRGLSLRKSEFIAMLAHELRNPLTPIRNALMTLSRLNAETDAQGAKKAALLQMATRQLDYLLRLTNDLIDVERIDHGKIRLDSRACDLSETLKSASELCKPDISAKGQSLTVDCREPLLVDGDPVRLTQLLAALIGNASSHSGAGGRIGVSARREDQAAVVRVEDDGVGIPADKLDSIFNMFTQYHAQLPHRSGLGVGLALADRLARAHGGEVRAQSAGPGRGSVFIVRLPPPGARGEPAQESNVRESKAKPSR